MKPEVREEVRARLEQLGVPFDSIRHAPVAGIEDCAPIGERLDAVVCKNYFLTTRSRKHFVLCVVRPDARLRTADVSRQAGTPRLSFAGEEELRALLNAYPGAVSPMGLLFDPENRVRLLVDAALVKLKRLAFHPCDSTETLAMTSDAFFHRFLPGVGHSPTFVEIHDFLTNDGI